MKNLKPALPHIVAIVIFFALASIYFAPYFKGYDLNQHDMQTAFGMGKEAQDFKKIYDKEPLWTNSMFSGMPAYQIYVTNSSNILPVIVNFVFFKYFGYGVGLLVIAMLCFYFLMNCFKVDPWISIIGAVAFGFSTINILFIGAGHITKIHAIALLPGILGSLIYAYRRNAYIGAALLSIFVCLHISAYHIQQTYYFFFLVLGVLIFEFYSSYKEKFFLKFIKVSALLLIATIIGFLPCTTSMMLTYKHANYTTRGKSELTINASHNVNKTEGLDRDYIKQYSLGTGEVWSAVIPNVKGGASGYLGSDEDNLKNVSPEFKQYVANFSSYWGEQLGSGGTFYFGACIFLLFVLGMVFLKDRLKWVFFICSVLAAILSWKYSAIVDFFIDNFPLFNKFRDSKMILILVQLSFPILATLFLNELFNSSIDKKKLYYTLASVLGILFLFYLLPTLWFSFFSYEENAYFDKQISAYQSNPDALSQYNLFKSEIENVRIAIFKADVLRSILFIIATGGLILLFVYKKIQKKYFIAILGILVLVDIWVVDKRILNNKKENGEYQRWVKKYDRNNPYKPSTADLEILKTELEKDKALNEKIQNEVSKKTDFDPENIENEKLKYTFAQLGFNSNYRVFTLQDPFSNASVSYFHKSIGGYHGAKLKIYQELIDFRLSKEYEILINSLKSNNGLTIATTLKDSIPTLNMLNTRYIIYNPQAAPLINNYANGNAWFVKNVYITDSPDNEILSLDTLNPVNSVVINKKYEAQLKNVKGFDTASVVSLKEYKPNYLNYEATTNQDEVCVFSEIFYKDGWNAYIDSKPSEYLRVNYVLRGIVVPAGKHSIEFKFEPQIYKTSRNVSLAGTILLILFVSGSLFYGFKKKN